jgi:LmbE family N-acetylglucosaminyl deacetylase
MTRLRILAVGAHPDDLEILCGGTLARYAREGHAVVMAHLLNGDKGHYKMAPATLARIRKREASAAGAVIGARVIGLDLPDAQLFSDLKTRKLIIDLVRESRPDVIITHAPSDYISDHVATSQLVCDGSFYSAAPLFKTRKAAHRKIAPVFFMDTLAGVGFLPDEYVDISETFRKKIGMLEQHRSQLQWLKEHDHTDIVGFVETAARFRGLQCGVRYAEGFRRYEAWGRIVPRRLLPE